MSEIKHVTETYRHGRKARMRNRPNDAHERRPGRAGGKNGCRNFSLGSARPSWSVMRGREISGHHTYFAL